MIETSDDEFSKDADDVASELSSTCDIEVEESTSNVPGKRSRRVRFSTVEVREHEILLGDHPWCSDYPLSIGWGHLPIRTLNIEDVEENKAPAITLANRAKRVILRRELEYRSDGGHCFVTHVTTRRDKGLPQKQCRRQSAP